MTALLYIIAFALAALRIVGEKSPAFQAVAHLFVGGLFAAAYIEHRYVKRSVDARRWMILAIALSAVELGCFLWFRFGVA